jgi:hypothetical protein
MVVIGKKSDFCDFLTKLFTRKRKQTDGYMDNDNSEKSEGMMSRLDIQKKRSSGKVSLLKKRREKQQVERERTEDEKYIKIYITHTYNDSYIYICMCWIKP